MGFSLRILIILFVSFVNFSAPSLAKEGAGFLSIPDFSMHRVTPQKTSGSSINEELSKETGSEPASKITVIKETPKLRYIVQSEQKPKPHAEKANMPEKNKPEPMVRIETPPQRHSNTQVQPVSEPIKSKNANIDKKPETDNILEKPSDTASQDEFVSKINQINEKNQSSTKNTYKGAGFKDTGNSFLRTFSSLSIVLLLIFVFAWVYAKVKGINPAAILTGKFSEKDLNRFNVISTSTLGQGKDIHLVEINGKQLVIGSTANNINLLTELDPEEVEKLKEKKQKSENNEEVNQFKSEEPEEIEHSEAEQLPEEENFYYESMEEDEDFVDPDFYSLKYSEVYKEYINKEDDKKDSE